MFTSLHTTEPRSAAQIKSTPFFQPKLTVNTPGDAYEQEADQVADQVMRMREGDAPVVQRMPLTPLGGLQRKCTECEKEEKEKVQRKESGGGDAGGHSAPPIVSDVLSSGGGQSMDGGTRQFMESRFGQDFGQVRIHTGGKAAESAAAIQARAYTSGRDVVFGAGEYRPESESGKRLLAHELVHVGQQGGGGNQDHLQRTATGALVGGSLLGVAGGVGGAILGNMIGGIGGAIGLGLLGGLGGLALGGWLGHKMTGDKKSIGEKLDPDKGVSPYKNLNAFFDGREFILYEDAKEIFRVGGQSGRPYTVSKEDAQKCGGSEKDSYMNNPLYVGIRENGPIPEGTYSFSPYHFGVFSRMDQLDLALSGKLKDPWGDEMHGDWGAGRVALSPISRKPAKKGCGNTQSRSGFYLHGGVLPGSSGCIDVGNEGIRAIIGFLTGYKKTVKVRVEYKHPAEDVGWFQRMMGEITYDRP